MRDNPTQENPMLNVRGLTVTVQKEPSRHILNDINFDVHGGQILSVLGPSGAGKTTLLRCLALLHTETTGTIRVNGAPVNSLEAGKIGIVFQNFNLFPHLSVLDNMVLAPKCHKKDTLPALIEHAHSLLAQFGIVDHAHAYPHSLSGGQKQRVAIARALMMDPPILLFDEPTSALDPELVHDVATIIKTLRKPDRVIIVVTHEIRLAKHVADQILFLDKGIVLDNVPKEVFFGNDERTISPRAHTFLSNLG